MHTPPTSMKLISLNCQGLGRIEALNYLLGLVRKYNPHCIFLSETKGGNYKFKSINRILGFNNIEIVESNGAARCLIFLWKEEVNIFILWKSDNVISCMM